MRGIRHFFWRRCTALFLWLVVVLPCSAGQAAGPVAGGEPALLAKYPAIKANLEHNQYGAPIYLESAEAEHSLRVDMYGIFNHPFNAVRVHCSLLPIGATSRRCTST